MNYIKGPHQVPVALPGVELHGKPAGIAEGLRGASLVNDGGKPNNDRRLHTGCAEHIGACQVCDVMGDLQINQATCQVCNAADDLCAHQKGSM
jgi:hypothetical protein